MKIEGERIILRPILSSDFPAIIKWTRDPEVGHYMDDDGYPKLWQIVRSGIKTAQQPACSAAGDYYPDEVPIGDIELDHIAWRSGMLNFAFASAKVIIGERVMEWKVLPPSYVMPLVKWGFPAYTCVSPAPIGLQFAAMRKPDLERR